MSKISRKISTPKLITMPIEFLTNPKQLQKEFERLCQEYKELIIFSAWIGKPGSKKTPFCAFENNIKIKLAVLGKSFNQSHPEGFKNLLKRKIPTIIVESFQTFHPKFYLFTNNQKKAIIIGSSNLTTAAFHTNFEANVLLEGIEFQKQINQLESDYMNLISKTFKSNLNSTWLKSYTKEFHSQSSKGDHTNEPIVTGTVLNDDLLDITDLTFDDYVQVIKQKQIKAKRLFPEESFSRKIKHFLIYDSVFSKKWTLKMLENKVNRRMLLGKSEFAFLGHVGASGRINQLLASGTIKEKNKIISVINSLISMEHPLNYNEVKKKLDLLCSLGPTMKVWGRILCISRPDIFFTISSNSVRKYLSSTIGIPKNTIHSTTNYTKLLEIFHQCPWYKTDRPASFEKEKLFFWKTRMAMLDLVFYLDDK